MTQEHKHTYYVSDSELPETLALVPDDVDISSISKEWRTDKEGVIKITVGGRRVRRNSDGFVLSARAFHRTLRNNSPLYLDTLKLLEGGARAIPKALLTCTLNFACEERDDTANLPG